MPPLTCPRFRSSKSPSSSSSSSSHLKQRLARKAELARASRRRKKAYMGGLEQRIAVLERRVERLKEANRSGVKWDEKEDEEEEIKVDIKRRRNYAEGYKEVDDSDSISQDDDDEEWSEEDDSDEQDQHSACDLGCGAHLPTSAACQSDNRPVKREKDHSSSKRKQAAVAPPTVKRRRSAVEVMVKEEGGVKPVVVKEGEGKEGEVGVERVTMGKVEEEAATLISTMANTVMIAAA